MKKIEAEKKALREEEEKKRIKEEKRKIKENKQKQMDYCKKYISERCMSNPNIINLFENIINTNSKYIDKELENFSRFFNKGQRRFRNILNEYIIEILNNLDKETRSIKDIMKFCNSQNLFELIKQMDSTSFLKQKDIYSSNIYKDSKIFDSKKIIQTILNYCLNQPDDNEIIEIYKQRKKEIESKIKAEKRKNIYLGLYNYEAELATLPLYLIYFYAIVIICVLKLCDSIEEFNNNEELITMYNNLISVTTNSEYIKDKLYPIYKKFYVGNFKVKLSIEEFWIMMIIKNDNVENIEEYDNLKINKNNPKKSLVNILSRKIGEISKINENRAIIIIAKILGQQKEKLLDKDIYNIIVNMDDILNEITKEAKLNVAGAEKERILKGDLSKEIEFEKLSLDISNIKDGFAFETYIAKLYCKLGYTIEEVTKKSGDQGADVIAYKDNIKYVIQAKFYSNPVGNKAVQEVVASIGMYNANKGIVVTNSTFTLSAIELANANNIELVDGEKIEEFKKIIIDKM